MGIRDALVGGEVSGNQRGNALVVSNTGPAKTFSLTDSTITEFQKTGAIFRNMEVTVDHNEIDGNGPHAIIGQNAMQLSSGSFGDVTNNTISGIGYTGPADIVVGGVLVFGSHGGLNIDDNTFNGTGEDDAGIYLSNSSNVEASGNILNGADYGVIDIGSTVNDVTDNNYNNVETNYGFYPNTASGPVTVSGTEGSDDLFGTDQGDTFIGLAAATTRSTAAPATTRSTAEAARIRCPAARQRHVLVDNAGEHHRRRRHNRHGHRPGLGQLYAAGQGREPDLSTRRRPPRTSRTSAPGPITDGENGWKFAGVEGPGRSSISAATRCSACRAIRSAATSAAPTLQSSASRPASRTTCAADVHVIKFGFKAVPTTGLLAAGGRFRQAAGTDRNNFLVIEN